MRLRALFLLDFAKAEIPARRTKRLQPSTGSTTLCCSPSQLENYAAHNYAGPDARLRKLL